MKNKNNSLKLMVLLAGAIILVTLVTFTCLVSGSSNSKDNQDPDKQQEMMVLVLEWGRLSPFPANATNISIKTEGSSFTRSFRASFSAPKQDIDDWIKGSPGLNETVPNELPNKKVQYIIEPGGGANRAEVTIDYDLNQVEIYMSWG